MSNTAAQGALSVMYVNDGEGSGLPYEGTAEAYEFLSESLQATQAVLDTFGIRGTRSIPKERRRLGVRAVSGQITMNPSPLDLDKWLPRILGTAESSDEFNLGDTFTPFGIYVDRVTDRFEYTDCLVTRATFRGRAGSLVEMTLDIVGKDEVTGVTAPTSPPSLGTSDADAPYVFHDACGGLSLPSVGTAAAMFDFELVIDNAMDVRFVHCATATSIKATDRIVAVSLTNPYDADNKDLYRLTFGGADRGSSGYITFTNGSYSTKFDMISLDGPDQSPTVPGKQEIVLRLDYRARKADPTNEIIITNVSA